MTVMRSSGDAGTAIHTSVPFGIAGIMPWAFIAVKISAGVAERMAPVLLARRHL
jgi:hypothetical protein